MAVLSCANLTLPLPAPYDVKDSQKQQENFFYALNQLLMQAKTAGFKIPDKDEITLLTDKIDHLVTAINTLDVSITGTTVDLTALTQAVKDLSDLSVVIDRGLYREEIFGRWREA